MKLLAAFAALAILPACNAKRSEPAQATATSAELPTPPPSSGAPWLAVPSATAAILPNMPFGERFEVERNSRPPAKPGVEEAFAALEKSGFALRDQKQHLAQPLGARYCVGAEAKAGDADLFLSVCEYVSPEVASSAAEHSERGLKKLMPTRLVHAHRHLALVTRPVSDTPAALDAQKKAQAAFDAL